MKKKIAKKILKQLRADLDKLPPDEFRAKYKMEIKQAKEWSDEELETRITKQWRFSPY